MLNMQSNTLKNLSLFVSLVLAWGIQWPCVKLALHDMPPLWLGAFRFISGALILFGYLLLTRQLILPPKRSLAILFSVGIGQFGIFIGLVNIALQYVETGRSLILAYSTPLWVAPLAIFIFKERMSYQKISGLILGLFGIAILFNPASFDWSNKTLIFGNGLLLSAAAIWGIVILHIRYSKVTYNTLQLMPWQLLVAGLFLLVLAHYAEPHPSVHWTGQLISLLFYIGFIGTAFACWAVVEVNKRLTAVATSLGMLGVPVVGTFSSTLIFMQPLSFNTVIALIFMISGIAIASVNWQKTENSTLKI